MNLLISLYDRTGNWSQPYRDKSAISYKEDRWSIICVDIQNGRDILTWDYSNISRDYYNKIIILAAQPCDMYATCGAKHFKGKDESGQTEYHQMLVAKTKEIIDYFNPFAWALENPRTRIHKLNPWLGRVKLMFDPCDYAGYDPEPDNSRYNKETWLFGKFNDPVRKRMEPFTKENPGWRDLGGKSLETKNARSITPLGFAYGFYEANH